MENDYIYLGIGLSVWESAKIFWNDVDLWEMSQILWGNDLIICQTS